MATEASSTTGTLVRQLQQGAFTLQKLDVARDLLLSERHLVPRKNAFLLEWLTNLVIKTQEKARQSENASDRNRAAFQEPHCWSLLKIMVTSPSFVQTTPIHAKLLQVVSYTLATACEDTMQLDGADASNSLFNVVCDVAMILLSRPFALSFRPSLDDLARFAADLMDVLIKDRSPAASSLLQRVFDALLDQVKQQPNQKKVFASVASKLVEPALRLHVLATTSQPSLIEAATAGIRVLRNSLFHSPHHSHLQEYSGAFRSTAGRSVGSEHTPKRRKTEDEPTAPAAQTSGTYPRQLFDILRDMAASEDPAVRAALVAGGPLLYQCFLDSLKVANARRRKTTATDASTETESTSSLPIEFGFFAELLSILTPSMETDVSFLGSAVALSGVLNKFEVYKNADESFEKQQFSSLKSFTAHLLDAVERKGTDFPGVAFNGLHIMISLNHMLVEPHLARVLTAMWSLGSDLPESSSLFWSSLLRTYAALRQIDELLLKVFTIIRHHRAAIVCLGPLSLWSDFSSVVEDLPMGQLTTIWNMFATEILENYVGDILSVEDAQTSELLGSKLGHVVHLFRCFTESVQLATEPLAASLHALVPETFNTTVMPLLLPSLDAAAMDGTPIKPAAGIHAAIDLFLALSKFDAFCRFRFFSSVASTGLTSMLSAIHSEIPSSEFFNRIPLSKCSPEMRVTLARLLFHRVRELYKHVRAVLGVSFMELFQRYSEQQSIAAAADAELRELLSFSLKQDDEKAPTAFLESFWALLCENFFIISEFVSRDELITLLRRVIQVLCDPSANPTLRRSASDVVGDGQFYELPAIREVLLSVVLSLIKEQLVIERSSSLAAVLTQSCNCEWSEDLRESLSSALTAFSGASSKSTRKRRSSVVAVSVSSVVESLVGLLAALPWSGEYFSATAKRAALAVLTIVDAANSTGCCAVARSAILAILKESAAPVADALPVSYVLRLLQAASASEWAIYDNVVQHIVSLRSTGSAQAAWSAVVSALSIDSRELVHRTVAAVVSFLQRQSTACIAGKAQAKKAKKLVIKDDATRATLVLNVPADVEQQLLVLETKFFGSAQTSDSLYMQLVASFVDFHRLRTSKFRSTTPAESSQPSLTHVAELLRFVQSALRTNDCTSVSSTLLHCLRSVVAALPLLNVQGSLPEYATVLALAYRLIQVTSRSENSDLIASSWVIYSTLLEISSKEELGLLIRHLVEEVSAGSNDPAFHRARCGLAVEALECFFNEVDQSMRYQVVPAMSSNIMVALSQLLSAPRPASESVQLRSLRILQRLIADKFIMMTPRHVALVLGTFTRLAGLSEDSFVSMELFTAYYRVMWSLLSNRSALATKCVAAMLMGLRFLLQQLVKSQSFESVGKALPVVCAENLARLYTGLTEHASVMKKFAIYIVVDYLQLLEYEAVSQVIRDGVLPGVYALLDICSEAEYNHMFKAMDETGKSMFRTLLAEYKRDFKFTGKV